MLVRRLFLMLFVLAVWSPGTVRAEHKALIIDGQNNHPMWPKTTAMMKKYLEETGLFTVDVARTRYTWQGDELLNEFAIPGLKTEARSEPIPDPNFRPKFSDYDVVVSNFGWRAAPWPAETQQALTDFVHGGGGFVVVHAANNSFGQWQEFNRMIGLGGWDNRNEKSGPYVYLNNAGQTVRSDSPGTGGSHGDQHEFQIVVREPDHPIVKGMPRAWLHARDELYDRLRGPAENMKILATAYSAPQTRGSGRHEPMILTIDYGQGRVFHTPMGHADYSVACVGFIVTFQRGTEWAASGKVTQTSIPADFPTADAVSQREF